MTSDLSKKRDYDPSQPDDRKSIVCRTAESPKLRVSVRSRSEADCAISAGVDILDVKEPSLGSLGMAGIDHITEIAHAAEIVTGTIPLSVALGEVRDWSQEVRFPELPHGITFAKLGLSECATDQNWRAVWMRVRTKIQESSLSKLRWVAVAYADSHQAKSPDIHDVLTAAIETDCSGLLIDTFTKDGRRLNDEVGATALTKLAETCHQAGLFLALAGRLNRESLPLLSNTNADVIAIRSAACRGADRTLQLDTRLIAEFKKELLHRFAVDPERSN